MVRAQVVSGDSWASVISRSLWDKDDDVDPGIAFFFILYFFVASTVLMNVLVAVLLDEFIMSVTKVYRSICALRACVRACVRV